MTTRERAEAIFAEWVKQGHKPFDDNDWMNPEDKEPFLAGIGAGIDAAVADAVGIQCAHCHERIRDGICSYVCAVKWMKARGLTLFDVEPDPPPEPEPTPSPYFCTTGSV